MKNRSLLEEVEKSAQCATLLSSDLRSAHRASVESNQCAEILLLQLINDVSQIRNRIDDLHRALKVERDS